MKNGIYRIYELSHAQPDHNTKVLAARILIENDHLTYLEDHTKWLKGCLQSGPTGPHTEFRWHILESTPFLSILPESAIHEGMHEDEIPEYEFVDYDPETVFDVQDEKGNVLRISAQGDIISVGNQLLDDQNSRIVFEKIKNGQYKIVPFPQPVEQEAPNDPKDS
jgi:hypothetical protein